MSNINSNPTFTFDVAGAPSESNSATSMLSGETLGDGPGHLDLTEAQQMPGLEVPGNEADATVDGSIDLGMSKAGEFGSIESLSDGQSSGEGVRRLRDAFESALDGGSGSGSTGSAKLRVEIPQTASPIDLLTMQASTPKAMERRWDLADPKDAMELLTRFSKVHRERLELEKQALPMVEFWASMADSNFENVDAALGALEALTNGLSEEEIEKSCRKMFNSGKEEIAIRGVVIRDPGIIQAVKAIRMARHPLTIDEQLIAEKCFQGDDKVEFSKATLYRLLEEANQIQLDRFSDVADWYDMYERETEGFEEVLQELFAQTDIAEEYKVPVKGGLTWDLNEPALVRCLNLIRAKDTPELLESRDQEVLKEVLLVLGETKVLGFDRDSLCEVHFRMQTQIERDHEGAVKILDGLLDDSVEIKRNARDILSNSDRETELSARPDMMDLRFWSTPSLAQAMRVMAFQVDRPDYRLAGTDDDVPRWFFNNERKPRYNVENIKGLVGAMRDFSDSQSEGRTTRLCEQYNIKYDKQRTVVQNIEGLDSQFSDRIREYDAIGFAVNALKGRMSQGLGAVSMEQLLPEVSGAREGLAVDQELRDEVQKFREKTLLECERGNWQEAEENLARFGAVLNHVYSEYGESGFREIDFDSVLDDLESLSKKALKAEEWSFLNVVLTCITCGVWYLVRKVRTRGSDETAERANALRTRIIDYTSGQPISRIGALRQLRETVKRQVTPNVNDAQGREFMEFFTTYLDAAIYREMQEDLLADFSKQLKHLEDWGELNVSFSVGAGWGLPHASKVGAGVTIKLALAGGDDRRIREGESISLEISGSGGVGLATLSGKLGLSGKKGKTFKNVEDFVKYHRDSILNVVLTEGEGLKNKVAQTKTLKQAEALNGLTKSQMDQFNHAARFMGIMGESEGVFVDPNRKPVPTKTLTVGGAATLSEKLGFSKVSVSLKQKASHAKTFFYKRIDYLEYLKSNLDLLTTVEAPKNPASVGVPRRNGYESMEAFKERLSKVERRSVRTQMIVDTMSGLHTEFKHYCQVTRYRDSMRRRFSFLWPSKIEREMRDIKRSFQSERGVPHRGEYIRACMLTYANLLGLLKGEMTAKEFKEVDLTEIEKAFIYPKIELSETQLNKMKKTLQKQGTSSEVLFSAAASPGFGLTGEVTGAIQSVNGNANPDNDGIYLNLSIQATAATQQVLAGMVGQIESIAAVNLTNPAKLAEAVSKALGRQISTGAEAGPLFNLGLSADLTGKVELHFIKTPSLRLQYVRVTGIQTLGGSVEDIPIGYGGMFSVGAKKETVVEFAERIGNNTLTYVQTQLNGFKLAGGDWEKNWLSWCGERFTRKQLWKMAKNLGDENTNVHRELKDLAKGSKGEVKTAYLELVDAIAEVVKHNQNEADPETMERFCTSLGHFFAANKARATLKRERLLKRGWKPLA